jgi:hypothetical protein
MTECWKKNTQIQCFSYALTVWHHQSLFDTDKNRTSFNQNLDINNCMWCTPDDNMSVYSGIHFGCTLIVHRPLITLSKPRYVNEKTRYKKLISIPPENLSYDIVNLWMTNVFRDVAKASCDITIFIGECLQL